MYEVTRHFHPRQGEAPCCMDLTYTVKNKETGEYVIVKDSNKKDTKHLTKKQYIALIADTFETTNFRGLP